MDGVYGSLVSKHLSSSEHQLERELNYAGKLFEVRTRSNARYDISPDGRRFLLISTLDEAGAQPMTVVVNWHAGLKK